MGSGGTFGYSRQIYAPFIAFSLLSPNPSKHGTFAVTPVVLTPLLRNRASQSPRWLERGVRLAAALVDGWHLAPRILLEAPAGYRVLIFGIVRPISR